jgi:hypothetical protein
MPLTEVTDTWTMRKSCGAAQLGVSQALTDTTSSCFLVPIQVWLPYCHWYLGEPAPNITFPLVGGGRSGTELEKEGKRTLTSCTCRLWELPAPADNNDALSICYLPFSKPPELTSWWKKDDPSPQKPWVPALHLDFTLQILVITALHFPPSGWGDWSCPRTAVAPDRVSVLTSGTCHWRGMHVAQDSVTTSSCQCWDWLAMSALHSEWRGKTRHHILETQDLRVPAYGTLHQSDSVAWDPTEKLWILQQKPSVVTSPERLDNRKDSGSKTHWEMTEELELF